LGQPSPSSVVVLSHFDTISRQFMVVWRLLRAWRADDGALSGKLQQGVSLGLSVDCDLSQSVWQPAGRVTSVVPAAHNNYFSVHPPPPHKIKPTMRLPATSSLVVVISWHLVSLCQAFLATPTPQATLLLSSSPIRRLASGIVVSSTVAPSSEAEANTSSSPSSPPPSSSNSPTWESKQHLYGVDMIHEMELSSSSNSMSVTLDADGAEVSASAAGESLPLPQTYITCGKCNSLFAIAEEDLGRGKGW
jgi:hypothetical protein